MSLPCSTPKTLSVGYTAPAIAPVNGYTLRWRPTGTVAWTEITNQTNNPITTTVNGCFQLDVELYADCGNGNTSIPFFTTVGTTNPCMSYELVDNAIYTYVPCGTTVVVNVSNNSGTPATVCAVQNTVVGGTSNEGSLCLPY